MWNRSPRLQSQVEALVKEVNELRRRVVQLEEGQNIRIGEIRLGQNWFDTWGPLDRRPCVKTSALLKLILDYLGLELTHTKAAETTTLQPKTKPTDPGAQGE